MSSIKNHYLNHLMHFYSWSVANGDELQSEFAAFCNSANIKFNTGNIAFDFGCGAGYQSETLMHAGLEVHAIDFSPSLLGEMKTRLLPHEKLHIYQTDIQAWEPPNQLKAHIAICWGDTLTHFSSEKKLFEWLTRLSNQLLPQGYFLCSFRDYNQKPALNPTIIPVKESPTQLHNCVLHYESNKVKVSDVLWQLVENEWKLKFSTYSKIRLDPIHLLKHLSSLGFELKYFESDRMAAYAFQKSN